MGTVRLLLALSVVVAHSAPFFGLTLVGGKLAVQAFFIVSGFYMSLILNEKYPATREGNWLFYSNRFLRIYPMYWAVLAASFVVLIVINYGGFAGPFLRNYVGLSAEKIAFFIATNVGLFGMDAAFFMRFDRPHIAFTWNWHSHQPWPHLFYLVPQAWTLAIEVTVYALAPLIFRRHVLFLAALFFLSTGARTYAHNVGLYYDPWFCRFFFFELGLFALGGLLYHAHRAINFNRGAGFVSLAICTAAILGYQFVPNPGGHSFGFQNRELFFLLPFALCVPAIFALSKNWAADRWLGEMSYPIYLCHMLVIMLFQGNFGANAIPVLACVAVAAIMVAVIDVPIERWRQSRLLKRPHPAKPRPVLVHP